MHPDEVDTDVDLARRLLASRRRRRHLARGKGWVLTGVFGIPYYRDTDRALVDNIVRGIEAVLAAWH